MELNHTDICGLLMDIKLELEKQLMKKTDREINMQEIFKLTDLIPNRILTTKGLPSGAVTTLNTLSDSLYANATTHASLQFHLDSVNEVIAILCP
ncbi:MAG: hypothetical protein ABI342_00510 [Nitrososphaera sp.]